MAARCCAAPCGATSSATLSENWLGRFRQSGLVRHIFERVVWAAMAMGLVKGEGFAVDASVLEANASRYHGKASDELDWTDKQRQRCAVAEYLAALDAATEPDPNCKSPKVIWPSDPSSAWTAKANKRVQFGYGLNYLIDIDNAVIVDVEATPARTYDDVEATKTMIDRTDARFGLKPKRLAADTAYGTGKFLGWLVMEKRITPHIPVWDKSTRDDGTVSRSDFRWDKKRAVYVCPNGKDMRTGGSNSMPLESKTATHARSSLVAVQDCLFEESPATFTRMPAMSPAAR